MFLPIKNIKEKTYTLLVNMKELESLNSCLDKLTQFDIGAFSELEDSYSYHTIAFNSSVAMISALTVFGVYNLILAARLWSIPLRPKVEEPPKEQNKVDDPEE